ncbi:dihydroxyacetone kinase subunit DhaL [Phyllobacterium sp. 0TCS1.6C]|uniref:dihydroxyacetone kinase subunit DhaL n=1 Tax=unclassified Phyllobacterium TaxID=2638441 RepID=UPI002264B58C|nr:MULTISPECIES: dihydroxyacetone kinase subunit DhaL [unclassified Phyllobacterium]MCX8281049.1 dihydroxyacetone kinase subunit DhaL [Phyllobacterium sp. 0TCS1.6C]MCX8294664.1 dihydroxyacetone kinase subunit DhaL [Phyllobacterium sp. 0TCS1.6A]
MSEITPAILAQMFRDIAAAMAAAKGELCELDGVIGDADHGIAMDLGFAAVARALDGIDPAASDPSAIFNTAAKSFLNAVGASSGPLYATAFMRAGAAAKGKPVLGDDDVCACFIAMAKGIQDRGKAEPGEKTMIDAWAPAARAMEEARAAGASLPDALDRAVAAAVAGAEATRAMVATKGRSARLGERSLGHMDPGAASAVIMIRSMARALG